MRIVRRAIVLPAKRSRERVNLRHFSARASLPIICWEGMAANAFVILTGGAFLTGMAIFLGANDLQIGIVGAIPFLAQVAQLLSAGYSRVVGGRKKATLLALIVGRHVWLLGIPLFFMSGAWRIYAFGALLLISSIAIMIATPSWMSWIADVVPERVRGRFFAARNSVVAVSTIAATIAGGQIIDTYRSANSEGIGYAIIVGVAVLSAFIAVIFLSRVPDTEEAESFGGWRGILEPLQSLQFCHLLRLFFLWNVAIGISAAFFAPHMLTNLHMTFTDISLYTAATSISAVVITKLWGVLTDRFGSKPVLGVSAFGIAAIPLIWLIPTADTYWILWIEALYTGTLWAGFNLAAFTIPISNSPRKKRTIFLALFAVITGLAFFAASVIGGIIAQVSSGFRVELAGQMFVNYHLLFVISSILRFVSAVLILRFHEPNEKSIPIMLQFVGYAVVKHITVGRQIFPIHAKRAEESH